ncbi:MAG: prephenate dehydratase, partial [Bacteroidales bacterium]|nr:prephenate dehydratase [Bacteroidales bacterium]
MKRKVAIQGIGGCNHYIAARLFFKDDNLETIDCDTFRELAGHVVNDPSILGIMAIENTIAGSLLQNYRLLQDNRLVIVGEYKLRIT